MSKDTHKEMFDHSQAKVKLYGSYLAKYLRVIAQDKYTKIIYLYDMFCGEGFYENGEKGSPIVAVDRIRKFYNEFQQAGLDIKVTFNDIDADVIAKLNVSLKQVGIPGKCSLRIFNENYLKLLPKINAEINSMRNEKAVVFLDPKGYKEISIPQIGDLLSNRKTEVLVFLPTRDMFRFANMNKEERTKAHEPLHRFISEVFQNNIPRFESQWDFILKVKEGLKRNFTKYFIDTFTLERENGQFFCLFFFTSHIYGFEKMLETKWEIDSEEGRMLRYEKSGLMFSGSETLNFPQRLKDFLLTGKKNNGQIYEFCLHEGFLPKHANEILRDLQQIDALHVFNADGTNAREGAFYIRYGEDPRKVIFKYNPTLF